MDRGQTSQDVVCVHCRKTFRAEIMASGTEQAGFKCPHCRLFMPVERVADEGASAA
jgi:DNA-directed RNA polymerase subunit RPC12/RpoP